MKNPLKFKTSNILGALKNLGLQPILTIVLIIIIIFFILQFFVFQFLTSNITKTDQVVDLSKSLTFDDAVTNFQNKNYEVYTQGVLYVKSTEKQNLSVSPQSTPTPSITQISLVENKYDDVFFLVQNGKVIKIDAKTFGVNGSIFFNKKGELIFLDNVQKLYTLYPVPAETEKDAVNLFAGVKATLDENIFPLTPLLQDYKNKKFNPILYSPNVPNIYTGKWQHPVYTNGEVATVVLRTDPNTGVFDAMTISATNPPSQIYFDFRLQSNLTDYDVIPESYKNVPVTVKYKTKS